MKNKHAKYPHNRKRTDRKTTLKIYVSLDVSRGTNEYLTGNFQNGASNKCLRILKRKNVDVYNIL